ncbi:plasmid mobilization protein [Adlercreutzia sp. ZJ141]|uniref:plasmid mobilization protein n=1 Tax=Adlercreutzia sp. ZJ141 TaxID=2709406 RepID=UPI0013EC987D|nr:hypothetical protein [Adlercreutzia sp. ZJ141]
MSDEKTKRTSDFHIRMTEDEKARLDEVAGMLKITRSELVRYLAQIPVAELEPGARPAIYLDKRALALIHREMRRYGTNFNQATRALNTIALQTRGHKLRAPEISEALDGVSARLDKANENQSRVLRASMRLRTQ